MSFILGVLAMYGTGVAGIFIYWLIHGSEEIFSSFLLMIYVNVLWIIWGFLLVPKALLPRRRGTLVLFVVLPIIVGMALFSSMPGVYPYGILISATAVAYHALVQMENLNSHPPP
jgi:hypothetical protein